VIERAFDAGFANAVLNHESVYSWVRGPHAEGRLDLSPLVADQRNLLLVGEHGIAIFAYRVPCVYEWHAAVRPEGHGRWALEAARAALDYVFRETDAVAILAAVPEDNKAARYIVRTLGFGLKQVLPSSWSSDDGEIVSLCVYVLLRREWMPCQ
jgi:RimJ/RimL family protein N-acetyltransferase